MGLPPVWPPNMPLSLSTWLTKAGLPVVRLRTILVSCVAVRRGSMGAMKAGPQEAPMLRARLGRPGTAVFSDRSGERRGGGKGRIPGGAGHLKKKKQREEEC